jgi:AMMECR1 domain-containing protein
MAGTKARQVTGGFPWQTLPRPLGAAAAGRLATSVRALLAWQRQLDRWPRALAGAPATPFVSLYAGGRLSGCIGSHEGGDGERLARAFVRALEDTRFGAVGARERTELSAQVTYLRDARELPLEGADRVIEVGTHGVALVQGGAAPVLLLPQVARDNRLDARGLLQALERKAKAKLEGGRLFLFEADDVVVRQSDAVARWLPGQEIAQAARWLASLVERDGSVCFAVDPRKRERAPTGVMHHGRAAVVVQALAAHGGHASVVARARRKLARDIREGLAGRAAPGWPLEPATVGGTLALAVLAGVPLREELGRFAAEGRDALATSPWHAAQVVAALGAGAPPDVWKVCVTDLELRPWAPWTALAARARGDGEVLARTAAPLVASVRAEPPHSGGVSPTTVPECALTALVAEALAGVPGKPARAAAARACLFLRRWQLGARAVPAPLDPSLAWGAFPLSPVFDVLRGDVTAHALLTLLALRG